MCPVIAELIRALAAYEKLSHRVVLDDRLLQKHLFGEPRFAEVLLAEDAGTIAGFALFFHNYSTFRGQPGIYLEDLFVRPGAARPGATARRLLIEIWPGWRWSRGCGRLEWSVLNWNEPALRFYRGCGGQTAR